MANVKITDLTPGVALVGTELYEAVQSAASVSLTSDQMKTFVNDEPTITVGDFGHQHAVDSCCAAAYDVGHAGSWYRYEA
jgi:hypothetical protein